MTAMASSNTRLSGNPVAWPNQLKYRPANWWDTIGFGHEDAYANALAYRALKGMERLAGQTKHADDQARFHAVAEKLRAAYFDAFYNPSTGVLAGWRSANSELHDYYFLWVNGIAIHYGLVPQDKANAIMDRLLAKMKEVGYSRFDLGLPGNLIPVAGRITWTTIPASVAAERGQFRRFPEVQERRCDRLFRLFHFGCPV